MLFSQRVGLKPIKNVIQIDSIDAELRNSLWNALTIFYWDRMKEITNAGVSEHLSNCNDLENLFLKLWNNFFKKTLDSLDNYWPETHKEVKKYFFDCEWYEIYDFIEFLANNYDSKERNLRFMDATNTLLQREISGYRFVAGKITQLTSNEEIKEIEQALNENTSVRSVYVHLQTALTLLADRKKPDYRNSIKESISAVEALCKVISEGDKATLGQALKEVEKKCPLHPAFKRAFDNLYGYTSDADGIRHSLLDESSLGFEDAKFMLVSCSAFINYLRAKLSS